MNSSVKRSGAAPESWDWERGKRTIVSSVAPRDGCLWQEEALVSPDGESFAALVRLADESFTLRVNDSEWEERYEKAWLPRFAPDGRLACLVMIDDQWTMAVDARAWDERFDFIWGTMFGSGGQIHAAIQRDMRYGMASDGAPWTELFENANEFAVGGDGGRNAAVVQVKGLKQADLEGFRGNIFSVADRDGRVWDTEFMNLWSPVFDERGEGRIACQARLHSQAYSIVVNGEPWPSVYDCVWAPSFNPATGALAAPVREGGRWGMALDGASLWPSRYYQCWEQQWSGDGRNLWAVIAPDYGRFTVARNDRAWDKTFPVVSDLALSPDGDRAAALACRINEDYRIIVDGTVWQGVWDMAWKPVFSPDGLHVAALVQSGKTFACLVDGKPAGENFSRAWPPRFSPDSASVLLRGIREGRLERQVLPLKDL